MGAASLHPARGEARVGPGAHSGGVRPRFSLSSRRRARLHGRRLAETQRIRGGHSHVPPGRCPGRAGSPLGWGPAQIQPARPKARQAAWTLQGRGRATQERVLSGEAWIGQGAYLGGVLPRFGLRGRRRARRHCRGKGVAWPKPSGSGEGAASPTGRSPDRAGSPLGWCPAQIQPSWPKAWSGCKGVVGPKQSSAGEGSASPCPANPGSGREPTRVGSGPDSSCAARGALGCMGVAMQRRGGSSFFPPGQRPGLAGSPLGWDPAEI